MDRVAIAGATGFIGRSLCERLMDTHDVVGLTRNSQDARRKYPHLEVEWRNCDLFSLRDAELTLRDVDYAIYLVHSMAPSARLTQAKFYDLDLILADNFARAAGWGNVEQIVYLGGIISHQGTLSRHLQSRREVEDALSDHEVPLTAIRAGLVMGAQGSSFEMLLKLVHRLPIIGIPSWARTPMSPISRQDVVEILARCIGNKLVYHKRGDVGPTPPITYEDLLRETADALGVRRLFVRIPFLSPSLSRSWLQLITGAPRELVAPLVSSLKCPMIVKSTQIMRAVEVVPAAPVDALYTAIYEHRHPERRKKLDTTTLEMKRRELRRVSRNTDDHQQIQAEVREKSRKEVRSVQRLPAVTGRDARWVAREYQAWLPRAMRPFLSVRNTGNTVRFHAFFLRKPLLELTLDLERSPSDRPLFYITGGLLADTSQSLRGRLEFRTVMDGRNVLAAIHEFTPALPWFVYRWTQAVVHALVMWLFGRHLRRIDGGKIAPDSQRALEEEHAKVDVST